jgi:hypothetical protein
MLRHVIHEDNEQEGPQLTRKCCRNFNVLLHRRRAGIAVTRPPVAGYVRNLRHDKRLGRLSCSAHERGDGRSRSGR